MTPSHALGQGVRDQRACNRDLMRKEARGHLSILVAAAVVAVSESVSEGASIENVHRSCVDE